MDFRLTDEQLALKQMVADFAKRELAANAWKHESDEQYMERRGRLAEQGLLGLTAPVEYGGGGLPYFDAILAVEEMAKQDPRSAEDMHVNGTGTASHLWLLGSHEQKERWLRPICEGKLGIAIAMSEPDAGSAATEMKTTAEEDGDSWVLNGQKIFVTAGNHADIFVVYALFGGTTSKHIGACIVERGTPGLIVAREDLNMADELQSQLLFENCRVPKANVLVTGNAFGNLIKSYNRNRLSGAAQAMGAAQAAYEFAVEHCKQRQQFGRTLSDFQGLQWMLADMAITLNAMRAVLYQACQEDENKELSPLQVSMGKVFVAENAAKVCDMAIQLFGGYGYMQEYPVNQLYRRVRGVQIYGGTMQIHRNMIAGHLLGIRNDQRRR